ncbi:MAG: 5-(carboxyamino)imidazole ribonucleotide synthase [Gammaproteobacteria bacterium]
MTVVGILGGGQLARMLALAGYPLGLTFYTLDPASRACASALTHHIVTQYGDDEKLRWLAEHCDCLTYEFEHLPIQALRSLPRHTAIFPPLKALEVAQDRVEEKALFDAIGIPVPRHASVHSLADLDAALTEIGFPAVLKTRRLGYDGRGQHLLQDRHGLASIWRELAGQPSVVEEYVPFERELSIIAVRAQGGETAFYPLVENAHRHGMLRTSVPRPGDPLNSLAQQYVTRLLDALGYVGVLVLELFEVDDRLLANEFAPRVHNSGHWTIEGAETSQFENHLRAILGLPLGSCCGIDHSAMFNLIGELPETQMLLGIPGAHLHVYGKDPRPHRKLGHITLRARDAVTLAQRMESVRTLIDPHSTVLSSAVQGSRDKR